MISSKKISQFSLLDEIFYLLLQIKTIVHSLTIVSVEMTILVLITLVGISLHFFRTLQGRIILELHKHLFKRHVQGNVLLTPCRRACLLVVSIFLFSRSCFLWTKTLLRMVWEICFHSLNSLPFLSYNCVFCIHEVLG